ncbi:hypothetical protein K2173_008634 [Erythroxylum novogranatense]|uniref:DUF7610 domain-containing protein n=1 Tax=Erythroxylum novogranatense TaxID=1862640 RepID=A0AAV8SLM0_9ROSI|nr:hypothetical protein K2173_008634 [Erythroxylum novogranatense]
MTKRFAILQNKIDELESELLDLAHHNPDRQPDSQDIEQRFVFLRTLLSTEVASSPAKPHHLQHIDKRLTELEAAFHNWDEFRTTLDDDDDMVSKCSCTESCLNEDGETQACSFDELGSPFFHEPHHVVDELLPSEMASPPPPPPTPPETEGKAVHHKSEGKEVGVRKVCGAISCGVVIGIVFMGLVMLRMLAFFHRTSYILNMILFSYYTIIFYLF